MQIQFGDFVFPYNPRRIEVSKGKNLRSFSTINGKVISRVYGEEPTVVRCQGELVGERGKKIYEGLNALLKNGEIGVLSLSLEEPFYARLKSLRYLGEGAYNTIKYYAEFVEALRL